MARVQSLTTSFLLVAAPLLFMASGCKQIEEKQRQIIDRKTPGPGDIPDDDPVTPVITDLVVINSVQPSRGLVAGGEAVEIIGTGFLAEDGSGEPVQVR